MEPVPSPAFVAIARIARTRGNRGELLADSHTDFPSRFDESGDVWLEFPDGRRDRFRLAGSWEHKGRMVLRFEGIETISEAEELVGAWVMIPGDQLMPLPEGAYYDHELVGCTVRDAGGKTMGVVADVLRFPGNSLLVVQGPGGEFLVPAAADICREVRPAEKVIIVDLPEGLIDLNP